MDNRSWFAEQQKVCKSRALNVTKEEGISLAHQRAGSFCEAEQDPYAYNTIHLRGENIESLVDQTSELVTAHAFNFNSRGARSQQRIEDAKDIRKKRSGLIPSNIRRRKMGYSFRNSSSESSVVFGKRTVKDGECCGIWDAKGDYKVVLGPKRMWLTLSRVRFMDRHIADSHQYLEVRYRTGKKEHKRGPLALFEDPVVHESISVMNAVTVDAFEVIIVYTEDENGHVKRNMVSGPTVFVPAVNQWLHVFRWHGSKPGGDEYTKVPGALVFTKLRTIADQFYFNAVGVRTADDASLTVKVMIFYKIENLELMLNSTHDPVGDFINAILADLMNWGAAHTMERFIQDASQLSDLGSYPVLCSRAAAVGFKVGKVVYRGYTANGALQTLSDQAIKTRTELKLKQEEVEQREKMRDKEVAGANKRGTAEREEEAAKQKHRLALEAEAHKEALRKQEESAKAALESKMAADAAKLAHLEGLKALGVDLTRLLVAGEEKAPDKVLRIVGGREGLNVHTSV